MTEPRSRTLCIHLDFKEGKPCCLKRPNESKKSGFPHKSTKCKEYYYVFDFSKLYDHTYSKK